MSDQEQSSSGCCSCAMFVLGGLFLLGVFTFEPITMLVSIVLGGGLIVGGYIWGTSHKTAPNQQIVDSGSGSPAGPAPDSRVVDPLPRTARREHTPPAPRGTALRPWVESSRTTDVAGEFFRQSAYEKIFQGLPKNGVWHNLDLDAEIYPDPTNPHSRSGAAVSVWVQGHHAGFLDDENAARYSPMLRDLAENHQQYLRVTARVSGYFQRDRGKWHINTRLGLPEPRDVLPRNQLPDGDLELLPAGRVIQVIGEENHIDYLAGIVDPSGPSHFIATLRPIQMGARTFYDTVKVLIDGNEVGTFSRAMGEQTAALVKLIETAGKIPVARATIEGNALRVEVKVRMQRAAEFDHDRVSELQQIARERRASSNHRGETFDWDDDLAAKRDRNRGREVRQQQGPETEHGGS